MEKTVAALAVALQVKGWRLVLAESCTGGGMAVACTDRAGSSAWFECGFVCYSNSAKQAMLGVSAQTLTSHGAVSKPVVMEMVQGAVAHSEAQVAVAVSGIAGPEGGTPTKPVGTVCFAWLVPGQSVKAATRYFPGDRAAVRQQAVAYGLGELLGMLV